MAIIFNQSSGNNLELLETITPAETVYWNQEISKLSSEITITKDAKLLIINYTAYGRRNNGNTYDPDGKYAKCSSITLVPQDGGSIGTVITPAPRSQNYDVVPTIWLSSHGYGLQNASGSVSMNNFHIMPTTKVFKIQFNFQSGTLGTGGYAADIGVNECWGIINSVKVYG